MNDTFMKTKPVFPLLVSMALPNVISMLVNSLYNIVDSLFVARISEQAMTALSLVFPVQNLINAISIGFGIGINAQIALYLGAGDREKADISATHGMALSVLHGLLCTLIGIAIMPGFLRRFTADESLISMGVLYTTIVFLFSIVNMANLAFEKMFQAVGRMKTTMAALIAGCVCNIVLDPVLIFGLGPVPALGIAGAALATNLGQFVSFCIYLSCYSTADLPVRLRRKHLRPNAVLDSKLYAIGIPAILNLALPSLLVTFLNSLLAAFSQSYVTVLGIYYKLQTFLYLPANGIVQGMRPLVGYNYGAKEHGRVAKLYRLTLGLSAAIMAVGTVLCLTISGSLHRPVQLEPGDDRHRCKGAPYHLPRLHRVGGVHHLVRCAGRSGQGNAVAGHLAVPLCPLHHAAGLAALPRLRPHRCLARFLDHRSLLCRDRVCRLP